MDFLRNVSILLQYVYIDTGTESSIFQIIIATLNYKLHFNEKDS